MEAAEYVIQWPRYMSGLFIHVKLFQCHFQLEPHSVEEVDRMRGVLSFLFNMFCFKFLVFYQTPMKQFKHCARHYTHTHTHCFFFLLLKCKHVRDMFKQYIKRQTVNYIWATDLHTLLLLIPDPWFP